MAKQAIVRPTYVRVFGRVYSVVYVKDSSLGLSDMGRCDDAKQLIHVQDGLTPIEEADTVLHEVIHGIDYVMGLGLEERQVRGLGAALVGLFQDNPQFAKYLSQEKNV